MHVVDLIRHAESTAVAKAATAKIKRFGGRQNHLELSPAGVEQAAALGRYAVNQEIDPHGFFSSPAIRALRTHELSTKVMNRYDDPVQTDDRLQELDWGSLQGEPRSILGTATEDELRARLGDKFVPRETPLDVQRRMHDFLLNLSTIRLPGYYWVFSHRNAIKSTVFDQLGWKEDEVTERHLDLASITRVVVDKGRIGLVAFNIPTTPVLRTHAQWAETYRRYCVPALMSDQKLISESDYHDKINELLF